MLLQPREIGADKLSVGAACWDGAWVMIAYLGAALQNLTWCMIDMSVLGRRVSAESTF